MDLDINSKLKCIRAKPLVRLVIVIPNHSIVRDNSYILKHATVFPRLEPNVIGKTGQIQPPFDPSLNSTHIFNSTNALIETGVNSISTRNSFCNETLKPPYSTPIFRETNVIPAEAGIQWPNAVSFQA